MPTTWRGSEPTKGKYETRKLDWITTAEMTLAAGYETQTLTLTAPTYREVVPS